MATCHTKEDSGKNIQCCGKNRAPSKLQMKYNKSVRARVEKGVWLSLDLRFQIETTRGNYNI